MVKAKNWIDGVIEDLESAKTLVLRAQRKAKQALKASLAEERQFKRTKRKG